jgi:hypothetical protein
MVMQAYPLPRRLPPREAIAEALRLGEGPGERDDTIAELRALVAAVETRSDRLLARYCGRPVRPFAHPAPDRRSHPPHALHHGSEWQP